MMKAAGFGACVCAVGGGVYATGGFEGGEVYDLPPATVYSAMARTDIPVKLRGGLLTEQRITKEFASGQRVKWVFVKGYTITGELIATAKPSGSSATRVTIEFKPGKSAGATPELVDAQTYAKTVGRTMMAEYLDASIEQRSPNSALMNDAMAAYIMANRGAIGRETRAVFDEVSREMKEQAQFDDQPSPESATKPSLVFDDEPGSAADAAADAARDASGGY
jgi:hypothetical protein